MIMSIVLILVIFFNISLGFFVLTQDPRSLSNKTFFVIGIFAAIWTFTNYMAGISTDPTWLKSTYALGAIIVALGLLWSLIIVGDKFSTKRNLVIILCSVSFFIASFQDNFIILSEDKIYPGAIFIGGHGWGLTAYTIYYLIISCCMLWTIFNAQRKTSDDNKRCQLKYIFIGMIICLSISALSSFILPHFSIFLFAGIDSIGFLIFLMFVTYAITKYQFFNIKVILAEFVIFILWSLILVHIFLRNQAGSIVFEMSALFISIILGIILIRTILHNIKQDKKIEELTSELTKSYSQLKELSDRQTGLS